MPINPFEAVVFNEGEPLDPDKLNKLQTNVANAYQTSSTLYNATVGQQTQAYIPVMNCGSHTFENLKAGVKQSQKFDPGTMFATTPYVVIGVRGPLRDKEQISVSVIGLTGVPELVIVGNMDRTSCLVNWIAMEKRAIS